MAKSGADCKAKINRVETTPDCLTDRAGLSLFVRYMPAHK